MNHEDIVYFMQRSDGCIKIGHSTNLESAIARVQTGAGEVKILGYQPGGQAREAELHALFAKNRIYPRHEWFEETPELLDLIGVGRGLSAV